ncbi:glycosyltransferase family 2 protein [Patescibacteria group bacterium]|nr:MAG: glycosyltransferase family 2 protein [Patescibacteria group bacterium]
MTKLSVHLVAWNGAKYIPHLFESLRKQTFKDWFLLVIDNGSEDNAVELIEKELANFAQPHRLIKNKENIGFAAGHNQAFRETESEYFLPLNEDMYLAPDCLEKMVLFMEQNSDAAAVAPRLMRWNFPTAFSTQVDALGMKILRNHRVVEQYTRREWSEAYELVKNKIISRGNERVLEVFGVSGAFPLLRRSAIKEILLEGQIFDESYHSYKEDVDFALRLASAGHKSFVLPDAVAYHDRTGAGPAELSDAAALANKKKQPPHVRYHSYKNHLMSLYKNEYWQNFTLDFPFILWYEIKKFVYYLFAEPKVLTGLAEIWRARRGLRQKRKIIKSLRKIDWREMRRWWTKM